MFEEVVKSLLSLRTLLLEILVQISVQVNALPWHLHRLFHQASGILEGVKPSIPDPLLVLTAESILLATAVLLRLRAGHSRKKRVQDLGSRFQGSGFRKDRLRKLGWESDPVDKDPWDTRFWKFLDKKTGYLIVTFLEGLHGLTGELIFIKDPNYFPHLIQEGKQRIKPHINLFLHPLKGLAHSLKKQELPEDRFLLMDLGRGDSEAGTSIFLEALNAGPNLLPEEWEPVIATVEQRHRQNTYSSLVILGAEGAGKTTALEALSERWATEAPERWNLVREEDIFAREDVQALVDWPLDRLSDLPRKIILVDNLHQLLERTVGGFSALIRFGLLVERTKSRILWVVTALPNFWFLASKFLPVELLFPFRLSWGEVPSSQLVRLYDRRLEAQGYTWTVFGDDRSQALVKKKLRQKSLSSQETGTYLKALFLERLWTEGNPGFGSINHYLLRACKGERLRTVVFSMPQSYSLSMLKNLEEEELLLLQALCFHGSCTKETLSKVMMIEKSRISLALSLLFEHNLIRKLGDRFSLNPPVASQLRSYLGLKNLLENPK